MRDKFAGALARLRSGEVKHPGDEEAICEALENQIARPVFVQIDDWTWLVDKKRYRNLIGFEHLHKLLKQPGEQIHVCDMTHQPDPENARKSIQKSVSRALAELGNAQPDIGEHLKRHIKTGTWCSYDDTWDWRVSHESTAHVSAMQGVSRRRVNSS